MHWIFNSLRSLKTSDPNVVQEEEAMPWHLEDEQIFVYHPDPSSAPDRTLPDRYIEEPGTDELVPQWVELLDAVFGGYNMDKIWQTSSPLWDPERVKLVAHEEQLVAISMAWHEPRLWPKSGFVYWVAVRDGHRGRGLGSFVLNRALHHLAKEGFPDAITWTQEFRLNAVRMYLKQGFVPMLTGTVPDEGTRWQRTFDNLGRPELMGTIRNDYVRIVGDKIKAHAIGQQ